MKLYQKQKRTKNNVSQPFSPPAGGEKSSSLLCKQSKEGTEMFILLFLLIEIYSLSEFCLIVLFQLFLLLIIYEKRTYMEISSVSPVSWGKMVISRFLFLSPWIVFTSYKFPLFSGFTEGNGILLSSGFIWYILQFPLYTTVSKNRHTWKSFSVPK